MKCICTTDRCVVQIFSQLFFLREKTKTGKTRIASDFASIPAREAEYGFSGFITTNESTKKSIGYPLSVFNKILYSHTKCQTDTGKKVMYLGTWVCMYECFNLMEGHCEFFPPSQHHSSVRLPCPHLYWPSPLLKTFNLWYFQSPYQHHMIAQAWYICVVASARKRQQERASHTLQVTVLESSFQRKRQ